VNEQYCNPKENNYMEFGISARCHRDLLSPLMSYSAASSPASGKKIINSALAKGKEKLIFGKNSKCKDFWVQFLLHCQTAKWPFIKSLSP
jgi:hypothetical protein